MPTGQTLIQDIVGNVKKFIGYPYVWGGESPSGFDCSGLVQYVLTNAGVSSVPRTSEEQYAWATPVQSPQAGDLVFAQFPGDNQGSPGHVGIAVGGGNVVSATDPQGGVQLQPIDSWQPYVVGYGRIPGESATGSGSGSGSGSGDGNKSGAGVNWNPLSWVEAPIKGYEWFGKLIVGDVGGAVRGVINPLASIADVAKGVAGLVRTLNKFIQLVLMLFRPSFWLRVGAFLVGLLALLVALYFMKESL